MTKMTRRLSISATLALTITATACGDNDEPQIADGIFADLGEPLPSASPAQRVIFESGREVATRRLTPSEGLGDNFNVSFCVACHEKPVFGGGGGRYRNFLLVAQTLSDGSFTQTGNALFRDIGCDGCHVRALRGPRGLIPAYTDLLIHDMGPDLEDGIVMGEATGAEFRTAPLWGVAAVAPYLHDGRADTLDQAIRFHGGEALAARDAYVGLADSQRDQVLVFLRSLGGNSQRSPGLLPPGAPVISAGEFGGPIATLTGADLEQFIRGRAVFDLDVPITTGGLGPRFNGDACRACHFDPVIGGSGPGDVAVIRNGINDAIDVVYVDEGDNVSALELDVAADDPTSRCHPGVLRVLEVTSGAAGLVAVGDKIVL